MIVDHIFVVLCLVSALSVESLPDSIPRCYRNDPNFSECMIKATETMRPLLLKDGIPELDVSVIEPYVVPTITIEQSSKSFQFKSILTNLTFTGLSSYKFSKYNFDPKTLTFTSTNSFGKIGSTSKCQFAGKILIIPLTGTGTVVTYTEEPMIFETVMKTHLVKSGGVDHLEITDLTATFPVVKMKSRFENFTNIKPEIIEALNRVLEENWKQLAEEAAGSLQKFLSSFIKNIYASVFSKVPYDDLFPISDKFS